MNSFTFRVSGIDADNYTERGIAALEFLKCQGNPEDKYFNPVHSHRVQVIIYDFEKDPKTAIRVAQMWFKDVVMGAGAKAGTAFVQFKPIDK